MVIVMGRKKREFDPMGPDDPRHETAMRYLRLLHKLSWSCKTKGSDPDDMVGPGYLAIIRLVETFREGAGSRTLGTYIQSHLPQRLRYAQREDICQPKYAHARSKREYRDAKKILARQVSASPSPGDEASTREVAGRLMAAINGLPPKYKRAVIGFYFEGMTGKQIAEAEGVTRQAVNARTQAAITLLREAFKGKI